MMNFLNKCRKSIFIILVGAALVAPAHAEVVVEELTQGWVNNSGHPNRPGPDSNNYTGNEEGQRYNSWAAFFIPAGHYTSATLSLTPSFYGDAPPSVIGIFDVDTPFSTMLGDQDLGTGVYKDLGSGRQYASTTLYDSPVTVEFNGRGLADINATAGSYFVIGFTNQTMNALPANGPAGGIYISGFGRTQTLMQLELGQLAPVPEPSTWAMLLGGLMLVLWRQRSARRGAGKRARAAVALSALALAPAAWAGTVDFEHLPEVGFVMDGAGFEHAGYAFSGQFVGEEGEGGGLVGAVLDGGNGGLCVDGGLTCPTNNASNYYGGLNDGVLNMVSLKQGEAIKLTGFDASFIGGQQALYPDVAGVLSVLGWRADGSQYQEFYSLIAPQLGFQHFQTSAQFLANDFVQLSFFAYSCDFEQQCTAFGSSAGQFGLDNLQISAVPESSTYLLLALGLLTLGLRVRNVTHRSAFQG